MFQPDTFKDKLFGLTAEDFNGAALALFEYQSANCAPYSTFLSALGIRPGTIKNWQNIPMLPIEAFRKHRIQSGDFDPEVIYTSSGTTGAATSRHVVRSRADYLNTCNRGFEHALGSSPGDYAWLCLLPSYLERQGSSLIDMAAHFISQSLHAESGFFLDNTDELAAQLESLEARNVPTILLGVSFALLDFTDMHPMPLRHTIVMETGGMKGRRAELVREELHDTLSRAFDLRNIYSEYGMTELMSQAYSTGQGLYHSPPWMRIRLRDTADPLNEAKPGKTGGINIIDLANTDSCAFIATQDLGRLHNDGSFEVLGRFDDSDARGCNLMVQ